LNRIGFVAATALCFATACAPSDSATTLAGQPVGLLEYTSTAPAEWVPAPTASTMRLAEFTAPGAEGEAEVVAYYFGPGQGGSVEANTARWTEQFFDESGGHPEPDIEKLTDVQFPTTVVTLAGSYARAIGMGGAAGDAVPGQVLVAAVVETPHGNFYLQLHGPAATVNAQRDGFLAFVRMIRARSAEQTS